MQLIMTFSFITMTPQDKKKNKHRNDYEMNETQ